MDEVLKIIKNESKTIMRVLRDGELGHTVRIVPIKKTFPKTLMLLAKSRPFVAKITTYKEVNLKKSIVRYPQTLTKEKFHSITVLDYDEEKNEIIFVNTWGADKSQRMEFGLFYESFISGEAFTNVEPCIFLKEINPLSQVDNRWKNVKIGKSTANIGRYGCLITSICMLMERLRGEPANPADGAYYWKFNTKGELLWASTEFRGIDYMGKDKFSLENCKAWTSNKKGCAIKVVTKKIPEHFVVCNKVVGDRIQIIDPIDGKTKFLDSTDYRAVDLRLFISEK